MGRKILAAVVALITGIATFLLVEMISTRYGAAPTNMEYMSRSELASYWSSRPTTVYLIELFGWLLATVTAGWIANKLTHREMRTSSVPLFVGAVMLIVGVVNMFGIAPGQPIWLVAITIIATIPMVMFGARLAK
ncbi:MAG: hypothetical protein ABJA02_10840 [Acidobacteriota bacterium]